MSTRSHNRTMGRALLWWLVLAGWVCVIWGHSLKPGAASDAQSYQVVGVLQRFAAWLVMQDNPTVARVLQEHPGIIRILTDPVEESSVLLCRAFLTVLLQVSFL